LTDSSGSTIEQAIILIVFANSLLLAYLLRVPLQMFILAILPFALIMAWIVASIGWSDFPSLTLRRASRELLEIISVVLLALSLQSREAILRLLFRAFFVINLFNVASLAIPSSFTQIGFAGIYLSKNNAGLALACALPIFIIGVVDRTVSGSRLAAVFAFATSGAMLVLTLSKTAIGLTIVSLILLLCTRVVLSRNVYGRMLAPLVLLLIALVSIITILSFGISEVLTTFFGDATFTGRDQVWRYALYKASASPFQGVGYGALWQVGGEVKTSLKDAEVHWIANQAHNGYIDIFAQLGYVGLILLFVFLIHIFIRMLKYSSIQKSSRIFGLASYALYIFWGAIIYNVTESSFFRGGEQMWILLIFICTCVTRLLYDDISVRTAGGEFGRLRRSFTENRRALPRLIR
jgi:exopolysaccharide production protein ExoQ